METRGSDICYGCGKVQEYQTMSDVTEDGFEIYCDACHPVSKLKIARDGESLNIYIDNGDDKEPTHVAYWHEDEWLEDAETVVPAMLIAMELFYTNPKELLNRLGIVI